MPAGLQSPEKFLKVFGQGWSQRAWELPRALTAGSVTSLGAAWQVTASAADGHCRNMGTVLPAGNLLCFILSLAILNWKTCFIMLCELCYVPSVRQERKKKKVPASSFLTDINGFWLTHSVQDFPSYQGFHIFMWFNFLFLLGILFIFKFLFSLFSK